MELTKEYIKKVSKLKNEPEWMLNFRLKSFDKFKEFANFDYDEGYGCDFIPARLKIVGTDWWLERHEYDGSEWWEFKTMFDLSKFEETNETEKILEAIGK